jgi:uncharacterized membrane protein
MDPLIITDSVRYAHLLSVAVGIGASFLADSLVLSKITQPVEQPLLDRLHYYHRIVWIALIAMWISGGAMVYIRTGFDLASFSPKLFSKLAVVSMLTLNALVIGGIAMPLVQRNVGRSLLDLPLTRKLGCAWIGAVSSTSWLIALAMGESKVLAASGWDVFVGLVPLAYLASLLVASLGIALLHLRGTPAVIPAQ